MKSYSQPATKQDLWVIERLDYLRGGTFVEVGAHDGVRHSNTLLLEEQFGWTGLLIEGNYDLYRACEANRPNCQHSFDVIGPRDGDHVRFILGDAWGGIRQYMPEDWLREHETRENPVITAVTRRLSTVIDEHGISDIDYLSVDVEGAEYEILWTFVKKSGVVNRRNPRIITVEFRYDMALLGKLEDLFEGTHTLEHVEAFEAFFVAEG